VPRACFDARSGLVNDVSSTCDFHPQINCRIKVAQNGQRCQYQFAPPSTAGLTNNGEIHSALFAGISQPDDFA
jgi:hypothetical protein